MSKMGAKFQCAPITRVSLAVIAPIGFASSRLNDAPASAGARPAPVCVCEGGGGAGAGSNAGARRDAPQAAAGRRPRTDLLRKERGAVDVVGAMDRVEAVHDRHLQSLLQENGLDLRDEVDPFRRVERRANTAARAQRPRRSAGAEPTRERAALSQTARPRAVGRGARTTLACSGWSPSNSCVRGRASVSRTGP